MNLSLIIVLLAVGALLLLAEIFVPGGIIGSVGAILLLLGVLGGFFYDMTLGLWLLVGVSIFIGAALYLLVHVVSRSRWGDHVILTQSAKGWRGYDDSKQAMTGKTGKALGPLHPSGTARIEGQRQHVVTRGEMIDAGTPIRVIDVAGNRVIVTACEEAKEE